MPAEALTDTEARLVAAFAQHTRAPAIAVGIVRDGVLVRTGGAPASTRFRIASMTKSFVAAAVLLLRDDGLLALDDDVRVACPGLAVHLPAGTTIRRLLTMTSGLATDDPWADRLMGAPDALVDDVLAAGVALAVEPGTTFEYSNLGYVILGRVVTNVSGMALQSFVEHRLLEPLSMTSSGWRVPTDDWARPYRVVDDVAVEDAPPVGDGSFAPLGGLWSTVEDLTRWVGMLSGAVAGPLSERSRAEMCASPSVPMTSEWAEPGAHYGFGLDLVPDRAAGRVACHSGGLPGYGSHMRWQLGDHGAPKPGGVGVIACANVTYAPMRTLAALLMRHVVLDEGTLCGRGWPVVERVPDVVAVLNDWTDGSADQVFAPNVALDEPYARRAVAARALVDQHGPLRVAAIVPAHRMRADAILIGDRSGGLLRLSLSCAPPVPVRVQEFDVEAWPPGD